MSDFEKLSLSIADKLSTLRVIPVLVLNSTDDGLKIAEILTEEGLAAAEITFRTAAAENAIRAMTKEFPSLYIGAGTVLNQKDLIRAFDAGARFAVAPGFNPTIVKAAIEQNLAFAPGICTPSEIEQAYELGCRMMKFFPAEASGGVKALSTITAPYKHLGIRFMPTGGITLDTLPAYLAVKEIAAVGGTWMVKSTDLADKNWDAIRVKVRNTVNFIKEH